MKPALLLIPGMFNTVEVWEPVAAHLRPHAEIRVADVTTQESLDAMAIDAWNMVANLPPGTPLFVAGFSMGGYVLIELLAAHAAALDGVAFIDTSARTETPETLLVREKTIAALERNFAKTVEGIIGYSLHPENQQNKALADGMRSMMHGVGARTAIRQTRALMVRSDRRDMLAQLRMPALVVCGREDKVVPPEASAELAQLIPGARLEWLDKSGHQTPLEQAEALAQLLLSLVQQAPENT